MAVFRYDAIDLEGRKHKGTLSAEHMRHAKDLLRAKSLTPISINEANQRGGARSLQWLTRSKQRVTSSELAFITRQLAIMADVGVPVEKAFRMIAEQSNRDQVKSVLLAVRDQILEGNSLADSCRSVPQVFSTTFCALIESGERSGELPRVLNQLAAYQEKQQRMKAKVQAATIYPAMLLLLSLGAVIFLLTYVFPDVVGAFGQTGQELPWITRLLLDISNIAVSYGAIIGALLVIAFVAFNHQLKQQNNKMRWEAWLLKLPYIGETMRLGNTMRLSSTLDILVGSAVPLVDAFTITRNTINSALIKASCMNIVNSLKEGASVEDALQTARGLDAVFVQLMATGAQTSTLPRVLRSAATYYEDRFERHVNTGMELLKPAIIVLTGLMILAIVMAILQPILSLNQLSF